MILSLYSRDGREEMCDDLQRFSTFATFGLSNVGIRSVHHTTFVPQHVTKVSNTVLRLDYTIRLAAWRS